MPIKTIITKGKVPVKIYTDNVEAEAYQQLLNMAQMPFIHSHIAVMPDVHCGKGAAVGVDIGCGMNALRLSIKAHDLPNNLRSLRLLIEAAIPVGFNQHKHDPVKQSTVTGLSVGLHKILGKHPKINTMEKKPYQTWVRQLGTLGGGNHLHRAVPG